MGSTRGTELLYVWYSFTRASDQGLSQGKV